MRNIMPATSPTIDSSARANLTALGAKIRARRKQLRVSMETTAEAAGISRVTLHRIERGGPAVTMGAYLNVITSLGLRLDATEGIGQPRATGDAETAATSSATNIRIGDYPQLRQIAWQLSEDTEIHETEALQLYERNWRHLDHAAMQRREQEFVQHLADTWSHGRLLV